MRILKFLGTFIGTLVLVFLLFLDLILMRWLHLLKTAMTCKKDNNGCLYPPP